MKSMAPMVRAGFAIVTMIVIAACGVDVDSGPPLEAKNTSNRSEMPKDLRAAYIASVQRQAPESYAARMTDGLARLKNPAQRFGAAVAQQGLTVTSNESGWHLAMRTVAIGCEGSMVPITDAMPDADRNRVEMRREGLTEWYLNGPLGVEQGFVMHDSPACTGPKRIVMAMDGDLTATLDDADGDGRGDAIRFVDAEGHNALSYTDLSVMDATGKTVPAWLSVNAGKVAIVVDDAGAAYPLAIDPLVWGQQAKLLASDAIGLDYLGVSASISGDTALVGAHRGDGGMDTYGGAAYVFVRSGSTWIEQAKLVSDNLLNRDGFGGSVSLSGDTALVGAFADGPNNSWQGAVYVFVRSGSAWTQQAKLFASDGGYDDEFGCDVSISGDMALMGACGDSDKGYHSGSSYVFVRNGGVWTQEAKLVASDSAAGDYFGGSVSLSGDTALVAAGGDDVGMNVDQGSAYVFVRNGSTWTEQAKLVASDGVANDHFNTVSLSGDTALVGAFGADIGPNSLQGASYVFVRNGSTWTEQAKLVASDGAAGDGFGRSVAVSGDTALMGAPWRQVGANQSQGSAYVFVRSGSTWTEQTTLVANDGWLKDYFGSSVALSGDTAVVGAFEATLIDQGAAYVFALRQANGDGCEVADDCVSALCVDGVCCDAECGNGDPTDCQACAIAAGALEDGVCAPLSMGTECRASTGPCDIAETCDGMRECPANKDAPDGTACPEGVCTSGICMSIGEGGAAGAGGSSSSSSSGSGGGQIDPGGNGGCACQTHSNSSPFSSSVALLGFALFVFRRRPRARHITTLAMGCFFATTAYAQEKPNPVTIPSTTVSSPSMLYPPRDRYH